MTAAARAIREHAERPAAGWPGVVLRVVGAGLLGDRLDTDIEGAVRVGVDSMLVLTGVTRPLDAVLAPPHQRPSYLARDLSGLLTPHPPVTRTDGGFRCGTWQARWPPSGHLSLDGDGDPLDALRALCAAAWSTDPATATEVAGTLQRLGW